MPHLNRSQLLRIGIAAVGIVAFAVSAARAKQKDRAALLGEVGLPKPVDLPIYRISP